MKFSGNKLLGWKFEGEIIIFVTKANKRICNFVVRF